MKFTSVIVALVAATAAAAAPTSFSFTARDVIPSVELNDIDVAAVNYLAARGLLDEASLQARGLFGSSKGKDKGKDKGKSSKQELTIAFHDPTGPVSAATQKEITKVLKKYISKGDQEKFPFCDVKCVPLSPFQSRSCGVC